MADAESGLLAVGGDLEIGSLELAYKSGIFPWPVGRDESVLWFAPARRAILDFPQFKIPKRLQRDFKSCNFFFRVNTNFEAVIKNCAASKTRKKQPGTWITDAMIKAYINFYNAGFVKSFETYNQKNELVGGLYGVHIGNYFAGESMFFKASNASKFALVRAIEYLQQLRLEWIDIQMLTPLLESFGAFEIPRAQFMQKLTEALNFKLNPINER